MKRTIANSARVVRSLLKARRKDPRSEWRNGVTKVTVKRKEAAWKDVLGTEYKC